MLTKTNLIDEIRQVNTTADMCWLDRFSIDQLRTYLAHLHTSLRPRGRGSAWVRPSDIPAIIAFECDE